MGPEGLSGLRLFLKFCQPFFNNSEELCTCVTLRVRRISFPSQPFCISICVIKPAPRLNISVAAKILQTTVRKFAYKAQKYGVDYKQYR